VRIFITGLGGYLAEALAGRLRAAGHEVTGTSPVPYTGAHTHRLGEDFPSHWLEGADGVVHLAHDASPEGWEPNTEGARRLLDAVRSAGVPRALFVSSYSAQPGIESLYGRTKRAIEPMFLEQGHIVVRLGLVLGPGGLFSRNLAFLLRSPVAPLVNAGRAAIAVVAEKDVLEALQTLLAGGESGLYHLACPDALPLRELTQAVWRSARRRGMVVNIPLPVARAGLRTAAAVGLRLPVSAENLGGLSTSFPPSDLETVLGRPATSPRDAIAAAVARFTAVPA